MNSVLPAEEIPALKAALAERDRVIETLRFEIAQLKRLIFGARSERLAAVMDSEQLPLLQEMPEDAPLATPITFKATPASSPKGQAKRTADPPTCRGKSTSSPFLPKSGPARNAAATGR